MGLNTLFLAHKFVSEHVQPGDFCIDATAGKGRDTVFLCELVKERIQNKLDEVLKKRSEK